VKVLKPVKVVPSSLDSGTKGEEGVRTGSWTGPPRGGRVGISWTVFGVRADLGIRDLGLDAVFPVGGVEEERPPCGDTTFKNNYFAEM